MPLNKPSTFMFPVKTLAIEDLGLPSSNIRFSLVGTDGNGIVSYQGDHIGVMRNAIQWATKEPTARADCTQLQAHMNLSILTTDEGELHFVIGCNYAIPSIGPALVFKLDKERFPNSEDALKYIDVLARLGLATRTQVEVYMRIFDRLDNFSDPFHI